MSSCGSISLIAGPQGPAGSNGTNGTNGVNAYTTTTANFTMPAEGANVTVNVASSDWMVSGQTLYVQGAGWMTVQSLPSSTQVALQNVENTANRQYTANVAPGTIIASGAKIAPGGLQGPGGTTSYMLYQRQLASTTDSGDFNSGDWRTFGLNIEVADTGGDGVLAASQITMQPGTYRARWWVTGYQVNNFQTRLRNITAGTTIAVGGNARSASTDDCEAVSVGEYRFTLAVVTVVELQARCQTTNAGDGFGRANSFGEIEVYGSLELQKETS